MLEVPWVAGEGVPDSPIDGTPYAELLEAGTKCEGVLVGGWFGCLCASIRWAGAWCH